MFGSWVYRYRWPLIGAWLLAAAALLLAGPAPDPSLNELNDLLPPEAPYCKSVEQLRQAFPHLGVSEAIVVVETREPFLTPAQRGRIEELAKDLREHPPSVNGATEYLTVRSPGSLPVPALADNPLISPSGPNGQAALVIVNLPAGFVSSRSAKAVKHIRAVVDQHRQALAGLNVSVTGSAAFGYDYAEAARTSHRHTSYATITAVVVILLIVYRSPVAAMAPLTAISVAAVVAVKLAAALQTVGLHLGTGEQIFMFVLLYGAGIDYSLLFISRFAERADEGRPAPAAAAEGLSLTAAAITAAAVIDVGGILMLSFARFEAFRTTGPVVALALTVAFLASVTLTPALVAVLGRRLFWPRKTIAPIGRKAFWPALSAAVLRRPAVVMAVVLAALAAPAVRGLRQNWTYDTVSGLHGNYESRQGLESVQRHWPVGAVAPLTVLLKSPQPLPESQWREQNIRAVATLQKLPGVSRVFSLVTPAGKRLDQLSGDSLLHGAGSLPLVGSLLRPLKAEVLREYLSADGRSTRLVVWLDMPPMGRAAVDEAVTIRQSLERTLDQARAAGGAATKPAAALDVYLAGAAAEIVDIRTITQADFRRIAVLTCGVIFVISLLLLRDVILSAFLVAGTLLGYLATLGVTYWIFCGPLGCSGLDWKVQVFLFVVMVAVGVDYSIFLAARFRQELRDHPPAEAMAQAVVHTGPVISSCGAIMAATLGSLVVGQLALLQQLGVAFALGMLADTFLIRPLLLPAFAILTRRGRAYWRKRHPQG